MDTSGVRSESEPLGEAVTLFVGGGLVVLVVIAAVFLLPVILMLYFGRYRVVAISVMVLVGVAFLAVLRGSPAVWPLRSPAVWPLPAFLGVAAVRAWRERTAEESQDPDR